jgi:hypothetical protein
MVHIFYLVFSQLAIGGFALLLLVPKDLVGRGFYRLMGLIYLLVIILARCTHLPITGHAITFRNFLFAWQGGDSIFTLLSFLLLLTYTVSLWFKSAAIHRFLLFGGTVFGLIGLVYSAQPYLDQISLPAERFLLPIQFLASALLLGAVNSGMWFGHWYLVTPNLPIRYLKRFNRIFLFSLLLLIFLFVVNLLVRLQTPNTVPLNVFYQIILGMRVVIGFGGSLLLYFIVWDCLRDKSVEHDAVGATRAATGFLYIAMITVFMGELCGRLLLWEIGFVL